MGLKLLIVQIAVSFSYYHHYILKILYISIKKLVIKYEKINDNAMYAKWICFILFFLNNLSKLVEVTIHIQIGIKIQ